MAIDRTAVQSSGTAQVLEARLGTPSAPHIRYEPHVDGLRAVAILSVLVFHAFPHVLPGGFVGVDVFFVISGYLITSVIVSTIQRDAFSLADFYARRIRRIFPALLLVLACVFVYGWHTMLADDLAELGKHTVGGAGFASNLVLWNEAGYFDRASESKPLLHLWSLGIEEQFYIVWPLCIWAIWRFKLRPVPMLLGLGTLSFAVNIATVGSHPTAAFYSPASRGWELMAGGLLAHIATSRPPRRRSESAAIVSTNVGGRRVRSVAAVVGLALIVYATTSIDSERPYPGMWALIPVVGSALLIASGGDGWLNRRILSSRPMVAIGLISYPLYLWHWPLLTLANNATAEELSVVARISLLSASTALAFLTYKLVERPLRSPVRMRGKVAALSVGMIAIGSAGAMAVMHDGFATRYPPVIQRATEYDLDGYRTAIRHRTCFMDVGQVTQSAAPACIEAGNRPLWVIWGDSAAASLYPGLRHLSQTAGDFRLAQFTSSGCPPIIGLDRPLNSVCRPNNAWTLRRISGLRPSVVFMAAMWPEYDRSQLPESIRQLKEAGVHRVVVVGAAPKWRDPPSRIILDLWRSDPLHAAPPRRLDHSRYGRGPEVSNADSPHPRTADAEPAVRAMATASGARYISLTDLMCNSQGCLTHAGSGESFYLDIAHLTPVGSRYVARGIAAAAVAE
jgi:peptidoglycan/LPS O-acetylase OafA/YrhL